MTVRNPADSNPLSPAVIANSFYTALTESSFNLQVAAVQQLAWSGTFLESAEDPQRFQDIRSNLLEELGKGLNLLGSHHPDIIYKLLQDIVACQEAVQAQETARAEQIRNT